MTPSRLLVACLLPLAVSACGIPDLVAHGVKEIDKTNARSQPAAAPARQPTAQPAVVREEPPPSPAPARESIQVETLR